MIRHLYLRIYLATLGALVAVVVLFALSWHFVDQQPGGRQLLAHVHANAVRGHVDGLVIIGVVALGVAVAMYPLVRRLTRDLEQLAGSMQRFGAGDLAARAAITGADEVARLGISFNTMADRVGQLLEAHGRMLANASHELRSPLARIRLALELHAAAPSDALMAGMLRDCAEIDGQVEEILLASKLDTVGIGVRKPTDLAALVAEECTRLDVPFDVVAVDVLGDDRLLRRLVRNLLENAVKHGQSGVYASVALDAGLAILRVGDRGPGIPVDERERIFEPFYRPARSSETGSGWGLGLALVQQISTQHDGEVHCLDRPGGGCLFEVRLPAISA